MVEVQVTLSFPHRRVGHAAAIAQLATYSPPHWYRRACGSCLWMTNGDHRFPGWVMRQGRYVFGLDEWYQSLWTFLSAATSKLWPGDAPGEVVVRARKPPAYA